MTQYNGACMAAQLARIQADDSAEAARLKQRALELLRRAYVELGYNGSSGIDNDPDLAPLFDDPEFQALVLEVKPPRSEVRSDRANGIHQGVSGMVWRD